MKEKINKAKYETAEEISEKIYEIYDGLEYDSEITAQEIVGEILDYIRKKHLFKSDYTK